ncbi:MAG: MmcB family DNA repair protein [Acetobacteraceae bacterium]|nr:MmcB family DNA repair protein [Acetobacteraceae bacterium]
MPPVNDPPVPRLPDRTVAIRRAAGLLCARLAWAAVHEVLLPNGRRADLLALQPDGQFVCIEVKSGPRDFLSDAKWLEYREFCDLLFFAVDTDFPLDLLPDNVGIIATSGLEADILREAPSHSLAPARRRALLHRFATLAANRLAMLQDPAVAGLRAALRAE